MIEWEFALEVKRTHPMLAVVGSALGMTEMQIDDLFRAAASHT